MGLFFKKKRIKDPELLATIRTLPCIACGRPGPSDAAHVTSRGAGGDDVAANVLSLCRTHHQIQHLKGFRFMITEFPSVKTWMQLAGRTDILDLIDKG